MLLQGYKTYIAAFALVALGIDHMVNGRYEQAMQSIAEGLGFIGLRLAVTPPPNASGPMPK